MFYGEDLASNAGSGVNGALLGSSRKVESIRAGSASSAPSIAGAGEVAAIAHKMASERAAAFAQLASRASSIAARIAGPYPAAPRERDPNTDGKAVEPRSALDELHRRVSDIRDPLIRMDPALQELSVALDVLERAIG